MAKMQIKRVGVLSVAKIFTIILAAFGLLIGLIYGLVLMTIGAAQMSMRGGGPGVGFGIVGGFMAIIFVPIFYGAIGFISGLIYGVVYNFAAGVVGGIELELENSETSFSTPPAPQWDNPGQYQQGSQQYP